MTHPKSASYTHLVSESMDEPARRLGATEAMTLDPATLAGRSRHGVASR